MLLGGITRRRGALAHIASGMARHPAAAAFKKLRLEISLVLIANPP
jgi:hypothetical protein